MLNILTKVICTFFYLISFLYPYRLNTIFQFLMNCIYSGWMKRRFNHFEGTLTGKVELHDPHCISVDKGAVIQGGVRLLAWEKFQKQKFTPKIKIGNNSVIQKDCF